MKKWAVVIMLVVVSAGCSSAELTEGMAVMGCAGTRNPGACGANASAAARGVYVAPPAYEPAVLRMPLTTSCMRVGDMTRCVTR